MECYLHVEATIPVSVLYLTYPFICNLSVDRSNSNHCMHFVLPEIHFRAVYVEF